MNSYYRGSQIHRSNEWNGSCQGRGMLGSYCPMTPTVSYPRQDHSKDLLYNNCTQYYTTHLKFVNG